MPDSGWLSMGDSKWYSMPDSTWLSMPRLLTVYKSRVPVRILLDDVKSITQVVGYAANDGVEWCVLTNGVRYNTRFLIFPWVHVKHLASVMHWGNWPGA